MTRILLSLGLTSSLLAAPAAFAANSAVNRHHTATTHHAAMHAARTHGHVTAARSRDGGDAAVDALNAQSLARARGGQSAPAQ